MLKILHYGEDQAQWLKETFNAKLIFLIRHPIPVALSRKELPRFHAFLDTEYKNNFTNTQRTLADKIINNASFFEQAILHWCLENAPLLNCRQVYDLIITYEQMLMGPKIIIKALTTNFHIPQPDKLLHNISKPSSSVSQSSKENKKLLTNSSERKKILDSWQPKVNPEQIKQAFEIDDKYLVR